MGTEARRGRLIVLEGIDGGGKSTLALGIVQALRARGLEVVSTKEPTDGPIGQRIRALARSGREAVSAEEELELFHEDRRIHVREVVLPALERGAVVVQDRSYFSTIAYQGERGLDRLRLLEASRAIAPEPDVLLVVDIPAELALERIRAARGGGADGFEKLASLRRIREVFLGLSSAAVLDGRSPPAEVLRAALERIAPALPAPRPSNPSS